MAKKSLMRNLGELVGGVWWGAKAKPDDVPAKRDSKTTKVRETEEHAESRGPNGEKVTLRRTTVEEMTIEPMEGRDQP